MSLPRSHPLCPRCVALRYNPPTIVWVLLVAIVMGVVGWSVRGAYEDREFRRTTARLCDEGIVCFGDRG